MAFLGWLLGLFKVAFGFAVGWLKGGRVFILLSFTLWVGSIVWAYSLLGSSFTFAYDVLSSLDDAIKAFMQWANSLPVFSLLYNALALDVLLQYMLQQWSVVVVFVLFTVVGGMLAGAAAFAPLLIWRISSKLITSATGGLVKT